MMCARAQQLDAGSIAEIFTRPPVSNATRSAQVSEFAVWCQFTCARRASYRKMRLCNPFADGTLAARSLRGSRGLSSPRAARKFSGGKTAW